jgi:hypothetical protein
MDSIPIIVAVPEGEEDDLGGVKGILIPEPGTAVKELPASTLRQNLGAVCSAVVELLKDIKQVGQFKLKEVELAVEISAEGGVQLIGTSKVGGKGAIKLKFSGD